MFDDESFSRTLFFPRPDARRPPPRARDLDVAVDGATLHLRLHEAPRSCCTVLLFHGNGEVVADWDGAARSFAGVGADLAVVDYRGYGQSTGEPSLRRVIGDTRAVVEATLAEIDTPLVVMGRSLGSFCAQAALGEGMPGVVAVILESGIADLRSFVRRRGVPPPATFAAADLAAFDPLPKLRAGRLPLLVLHGARDTLVEPAEAHLAFDAAATGDKELVLIDERGHNDLGLSAQYWEAMGRFLRRVGGQAGTTG